jgi:hypothetical protein
MIKPSSIPNEYYFGDKPGTLQYRKKTDDLLNIEMPENTETRGWRLCEHSLENLRRITPHTQRNTCFKILLMMRMEEDGKIWLKAALQNRITGDIALLTASNKKENFERPIKTLDGTWYVGHYRMSAPVVFWKELQNRLMY